MSRVGHFCSMMFNIEEAKVNKCGLLMTSKDSTVPNKKYDETDIGYKEELVKKSISNSTSSRASEFFNVLRSCSFKFRAQKRKGYGSQT